MRQLAALAVALLLVTAGCNAFPSGDAATVETTTDETTAGGDGATETTAETTARGTGTTAQGADLAPGLNESGVADPWKLADAHRGALNDTSYTVRTNLAARENGTLLVRSNSTVKVAAGGAPQMARYEVDGERPEAIGAFGRNVEAWTDENRTLYAMEGPNGTTYQRVTDDQRPSSGTPAGRDHIYLLLSGFETTVTGTETRDGTTLYRVNSTGIATREVLADELRTETVQNASLSALVTEDGLVREYHVEYAGTIENATVEVERTTRFTRLGETTVERPPWYDEAINATDG